MEILIAEDDPVPRHVLDSTLCRWGYEVVVTSDGEAACEAEAGFPQEARQTMNAALAISENVNSRTLAAILFARIGDKARSEKMAEDLRKEFPLDTLLNQVQLPTLRAIGTLLRNQPAEAVAALDSAKPYELGIGGVEAVSIRGEAFLHLRDGVKAAGEYQKMQLTFRFQAMGMVGAVLLLVVYDVVAVVWSPLWSPLKARL